MEYRKFGPTDMTVSVLGFGCWDAANGGYGDKMAAAVHRALDLGVTCFDTAPHYGGGDSELMLAKALGPRRKDVVVVTKCGMGFEGSQRDRPKHRDSRKESILPLIDQSLKRMKTDYIDVWLIQYPDVNTPFEETMGVLDSVVQQGKARAVGVINMTLDQIKECEKTRRIDVVQYHHNLFDRRMEREIFPYCQEQGIGVMAYGPMGSGILAGAYAEDHKFGERDWRGQGDYIELVVGIYGEDVFPRNVRLVNDLKPIAERRGKTIPQLALRWALSDPAMSVALVGMLNVQELEENVGVLDWALSGEDIRQIDEVFSRHGVSPYPSMFIDP